MAWSELGRDAERENKEVSDRWIGVYIGVVAVLLAICAMGGGNATKEATRANIEVTNGWAFFQSKNLRRVALQLSVEELELTLKTSSGLTPEARGLIEDRIKSRQTDIQRLKSEPKTKEGLDELFIRNKALEAERDEMLRKDPYFDYGQALLQIAIVIASVALISPSNVLLIFSFVCAVLGTLSTLNGFTLLFKVPFIA